MKKEDKEILLLSVKCLINLYETLKQTAASKEEYEKELLNMQEAACGLINDARKNNVVISKDDRIILYEIIKS